MILAEGKQQSKMGSERQGSHPYLNYQPNKYPRQQHINRNSSQPTLMSSNGFQRNSKTADHKSKASILRLVVRRNIVVGQQSLGDLHSNLGSAIPSISSVNNMLIPPNLLIQPPGTQRQQMVSGSSENIFKPRIVSRSPINARLSNKSKSLNSQEVQAVLAC